MNQRIVHADTVTRIFTLLITLTSVQLFSVTSLRAQQIKLGETELI